MRYELKEVYVTSYDISSHASSDGGTIHIESFSWGRSQPAGSAQASDDLVAKPDDADAADWILVSRLDGVDGVDGAPGPEIDWDVTTEPVAAVADNRGFVIFEYGVPG